jgi:CBS domain-containing protein
MALLVRHAMTEAPQTVGPDTTAADAAGLMRQLDVGVIPVVEDGELRGLVTDRDLVLRVVAGRQDPGRVPVKEVMTSSPVTVSPDLQLSEANDLMAEHRVRRLPVMKGRELVGILSIGDVAVALASKREVGETLEDVSGSPSTTDVRGGPDPGTPGRVREAG